MDGGTSGRKDFPGPSSHPPTPPTTNNNINIRNNNNNKRKKSNNANEVPMVQQIKNRVVRRKRRKLKLLLKQLAKELLTQYTLSALLNGEGGRAPSSSSTSSGGNNSVRRCVDAMRSLSLRVFSNYLNQHDEHSSNPPMDRRFLESLVFSSTLDTSDSLDVPDPSNKEGIFPLLPPPLYASSSAVTLTEFSSNHVPSTCPISADPRNDPHPTMDISMSSDLDLIEEIISLDLPPTSNGLASSFDKTVELLNNGELNPKKVSPKAPKKYSEKMKAEASIIQRIQELQKEGLWYDKRLPKVKEPDRIKLHRDYLIEEALWMQTDFQQERKWKQLAARKISKAIRRHFIQKQLAAERALKEEEIRRRRMCSFIAREVQKFWSNVKKVIELREQSKIEDLKKKALDQQLSFIVDQTEKYSDLLAEKFQSAYKRDGDTSANVSDSGSVHNTSHSDVEFEPGSGSEDDEETIEKAEKEIRSSDVKKEVTLLEKEANMEFEDFLDELPSGYLQARMKEIKSGKEETLGASASSQVNDDDKLDDDEFTLPSESDSDVENTIDEEEAIEAKEGGDHKMEIDELNADAEMSLEELKSKYGYGSAPPMDVDSADETTEDESDSDDIVGTTESESEEPDTADLVEEANDSGLASLLQSFAPERAAEGDGEEALNSVAAMAASFQPKGYTLSSTNVVTKVPELIKHTLREYQHIGLDWLVTMCDKKLNGILADEMGLGKTIQTIALLAHLACEKGNWGPHLIIVPTSVMLNWEMEFKKWCPGFKILTYYGSQKERKLKRTGWTKANSFHVCITSYKLVIQDHQSFRRKKWKYLILDEAQNIKNFKSQRWQLLLHFNAQRRLLLTGTPLQNNLMELWSLMHFLMPNVFQSHREFRDWFSNPVSGMVEGSAEYNENIVRRLHKVLRPFILRRLKSDVEKQLPKKYEHLVMCRLSKRQRFLYEEFMSRSKTRDTLNSGNLLSVINVLMQLRKVCNHPNLFEQRPVISPMQSDGIVYYVPSLIWNMLEEFQTNKPSCPVFRMIEDECELSKEDGWRIQSLAPPQAASSEVQVSPKCRERASGLDEVYPNVPLRLINSSRIKMFKDLSAEPVAKKPRLSFNDMLIDAASPPMPRLNSPIPFFVCTVNPSTNGLLDGPEDPDDYVTHKPRQKNSVINGELDFVKPKVDNGGQQLVVDYVMEQSALSPLTTQLNIEDGKKSDSRADDEDSDASELNESEMMEICKKRRVAIHSRKCGVDGVFAMGVNPLEFQLPEIQERRLANKKIVLERLGELNHFRCEVNPVYGQSLIGTLEIIPSLSYTTRRKSKKRHFGRKISPVTEEKRFLQGATEIAKVVRSKLEPAFESEPNLPYLDLVITKALRSVVPTLEERLYMLKEIIRRFVIYIPSVTAPLTQCKVFRPAPSRYCKDMSFVKQLSEDLRKPCDVLHSIVSGMATQFPDPRLIQYDCGKLQTLDRLLRQLKLGGHRVLIFTQMARMLDVLEAFLNHHGYIYLRLDGATRIDQRQLLMERFNTDRRIFCFILSTRSGGIGVNLTGADTVIFYDSDWNPTMDAQAQDRCHRIGQTRDVHIYRLVSEKTVEENILKKSNQKRMLGEIAIEGGSFNTAFFTKNTIHDIFNVDHQENDPRKRLAELSTGSLAYQDTLKLDDATIDIRPTSAGTTGTSESTDAKGAMQMFETALLTAEDDTDVQAARTVRAEAAAELAEFDESIALEDLDNTEGPVPKAVKSEIDEILELLNPVEIYAIHWMENCMEDWTSETYANAEKDMEKQKQEWEETQQRHLQELEKAELQNEDEDSEEEEDIITYASLDAKQVWVAQNSKHEIIMPCWDPPTPPEDTTDVYIDRISGSLYKQETIPENLLPPVYVPPKHPVKKQSPLGTASKTSYDRSSMEFALDISETEEQTSKKSPSKVARRDEPIFAPRSLFDRPSPALAKLRRDYRLQKYSSGNRTNVPSAMKAVLGPGSVTFPIIPAPGAKPPPTPPPDMADWMVSEDYALLQTIQNILELPLSLLVVNLAQTPNWELAAEMVNMTSRTYRTAKHCKWRYENIVGPREEGKLLFDDTPSLDPSSPTKKSKKSKAFIKITPPSPSKANRYLKTSQLVSQDNNSQLTNFFIQKFDTIKTISNKKQPTTKPITVTPAVKSNKQAGIFVEHGINYDTPMPATQIAQARIERIALERRKMIQQQQQAQQTVQVVAAQAGTSVSAQSPTISMALAGNVQAGNAAVAVSPSPVSSPTVDTGAKLTRAAFQTSTASGLVPLVLGTSTGEVMTRTTIATTGSPMGQKRQITLTPQQQQQYILQQQKLQQSQIQQVLNSPVQTHQVVVSQATGGIQVSQGLVSSQQVQGQILRTATSGMQQPQTQTVVLTPGLAQALGAAVGATVSVSTSTSGTITFQTSNVSTVTTSTVNKAGLSQQQLQRLPTTGLTLQDVASSIAVAAGSPQQQSQQPTLVSLTTMHSPQLATKLIQATQGLATFVQASPRTSSPAGLTTTPAQLPTASQQQAKEQAQQQLQQLKRIQVVTTGAQGTAVTTQTASGLALQSVAVVQSSPVFTQATAAAGVTASTLTASQKLPVMTLASATSPMGAVATVVNQGAPRHVQLLKQQTIGGKTVTRAVTDVEVAALLKQHGLTTQQTRLAVATSSGATSQGSPKGQVTTIPMSAAHTLLTSVGLQNIMKVQQSTGGGQPIATIVKPSPGQAAQQSGALTFPLQLSQIKTMNKAGSPLTKQQATAQQVQQLSAIQQQILLQRQKQQQQQQQQQHQMQSPTASKISQLGQVSQHASSLPTQFIAVQTTPKQLQSGLSVPQFQPVFKQVTAPGQVITSGTQLIHANVLTKPLTLQTITTSAGGGPQQILTPSTSTVISVPTTGATFSATQQGVPRARLISVSQAQASAGLLGKSPTATILSRPASVSTLPTTTLAMRPTFSTAAAELAKVRESIREGSATQTFQIQTSGTGAGLTAVSTSLPMMTSIAQPQSQIVDGETSSTTTTPNTTT